MSADEQSAAAPVSTRDALRTAVAMITAAAARDSVLLERIAAETVQRSTPAQLAVHMVALADLARVYIERTAEAMGSTGSAELQQLALTIDLATGG